MKQDLFLMQEGLMFGFHPKERSAMQVVPVGIKKGGKRHRSTCYQTPVLCPKRLQTISISLIGVDG